MISVPGYIYYNIIVWLITMLRTTLSIFLIYFQMLDPEPTTLTPKWSTFKTTTTKNSSTEDLTTNSGFRKITFVYFVFSVIYVSCTVDNRYSFNWYNSQYIHIVISIYLFTKINASFEIPLNLHRQPELLRWNVNVN